MKFNTIIIGGGLTGLTAGITLAGNGQRVAILATGQSRLHFTSGSLELLGYNPDGTVVESPLDECENLRQQHPYKLIGTQHLPQLAAEAQELLTAAGIKVNGDAATNHYRISPIGIPKPAWLTLNDYITADIHMKFPFRKALLVNIAGYIDFPISFLRHNLGKAGAACNVAEVSTPALETLRTSQTEMRATNIARILADQKAIDQLSVEINRAISGEDAILFPAVFGIADDKNLQYLRRMVTRPLHCISTLPPAVTGVRIQTRLRKRFLSLGGTFMLGSTVRNAVINHGRITSVTASNLPDQRLSADNFILATGSFMGNGLVATQNSIVEPIMNLDVNALPEREEWTSQQLNDRQPYMEFGVKTDTNLHPAINGATVQNLWAAGAVLSGHNPISLADSTGVDMITALRAAHDIINYKEHP